MLETNNELEKLRLEDERGCRCRGKRSYADIRLGSESVASMIRNKTIRLSRHTAMNL